MIYGESESGGKSFFLPSCVSQNAKNSKEVNSLLGQLGIKTNQLFWNFVPEAEATTELARPNKCIDVVHIAMTHRYIDWIDENEIVMQKHRTLKTVKSENLL